jgi:hypothetical protein
MEDKPALFDIEQLRAKLRSMPDRQLSDFRRAAECMCSSRMDLGHPPNATFIIELEEANAECSRRYVDVKEG